MDKSSCEEIRSGALAHLIPVFYQPLVLELSESKLFMADKLREEARASFLDRVGQQLMEPEELKLMMQEIQKWMSSRSESSTVDPTLINYEEFGQLRSLVSEKAKVFFTARTFCRLLRSDPYGRIGVNELMQYIMRKTWIYQTRISLGQYDVTGLGWLMERDVELYITDISATIPQLAHIDESLMPFYTCMAYKRFFFFLDRKRLGKIRITDMIASGFVDELLELRDVDNTNQLQDEENSQDAENNNAEIGKNWFSLANVLNLYGIYMNLDADGNGMLSKKELMAYGSGTLTEEFVGRVFEELAMDNKQDPADSFSLNYFFRGIQRAMEASGCMVVKFENINDELFDMIKPKKHDQITYDDLLRSKCGGIFINILIHLDGFLSYENREFSNLVAYTDEVELVSLRADVIISLVNNNFYCNVKLILCHCYLQFYFLNDRIELVGRSF
ncbi:Serine/threonine-protein phosphatase 2A regulatory subunit B'' subunit gamma [Trichinella pseudospiralis]